MTPFKDEVSEHLDGEERAYRADTLKYSDPDAIARAITNLLAEDGFLVPPTPRLLGFARVIRKLLEARN